MNNEESRKPDYSQRPTYARCCQCIEVFVCFGFLLTLIVGLWLIVSTRCFNPDEFEHLHASWCLSRGAVPYRDFFEHHTPWFYLMMTPCVRGADIKFTAAARAMILGREFIFALTVTGIAVLFWVGTNWGGMLCGSVSALLVLGMPLFVDKTVEIRPDVPAFVLWMSCLGFLLRAMRTENYRLIRWRVVLSGLFLGGAVMFTQKMLFTLPGVSIGFLYWLLFSSSREQFLCRAKLTLLYWPAAVLVPCLVTWAMFSLQGAGYPFIYNNFLLNARWRAAESPQPFLQRIAEDSWPVLLLAVGGVILLWWRLLRRGERDYQGMLLLTSGVGVLAGLLVIPVAMAQYYLMLLPLICLFAGQFVSFLANSLPFLFRFVYIPLGLAILQIQPIRHALIDRHSNNDDQLTELRFVMEHSGSHEEVMDGWRGLGVFRPHSWYYYFLHPEIRAMLPPERVEQFLDRLEAGEVKPKIIVMDNNLQQLSPRFVAFVHAQFYDSSNGIWIRKP